MKQNRIIMITLLIILFIILLSKGITVGSDPNNRRIRKYRQNNDIYRSVGNNSRLTPERLNRAYNDALFNRFDNPEVSKDHCYYAGDDTRTPPHRYSERLYDTVLDKRAQDTHNSWANGVLKFSQSIPRLDNMDEAVYMNSKQGRGITAFRNDNPRQNPRSLFRTEADNSLYRSQSENSRSRYY